MNFGLFACRGHYRLAKRVWRSGIRTGCLIGLTGSLISCASIPDPALIALLPAGGGGTTTPAVTARDTAGVLLVRRLNIPEYMMSRRVRFWADTGYLAEWPNTYWAERIETGMAREFVAAVRDQLHEWTICDATCGEMKPGVIVKVDLIRLDVVRGEARIKATAEIRVATALTSPPTPTATNESSLNSLFSVPIAADTAQGQAQAMAVLLQELARASATAILSSGTPPVAHP
jgi:uncharacterized lipoprotein YmbA